jgi:hypothetical protein
MQRDEIREAVECTLAAVETSKLSPEQWQEFWTYLDALQPISSVATTPSFPSSQPISVPSHPPRPAKKKRIDHSELLCAVLAIIFGIVLIEMLCLMPGIIIIGGVVLTLILFYGAVRCRYW